MISDELFMQAAIKEAEIAATKGDWAMGCVIVVGGKVVARNRNQGYSTKNRLAHAELLALGDAKDILDKNRGKATMFCTYEPCPMCFGAMIISKIRRVVVGIDVDQSGCLDLRIHLPKFYKQFKFKLEVTRGVLLKECTEVYLKGIPAKKHIAQYKLKIT